MGRYAARQPCPFCGWKFTNLFEIGYHSRPRRPIFRVQCCAAVCKAFGPEGENRSEATTLWNKRAKPVIEGRVPIEFVNYATDGSEQA